jgi:chemotaxis protein MotB
MNKILIFSVLVIFLSSCVTKKKYRELEANSAMALDKVMEQEKLCQLELENIRKSLQARDNELLVARTKLESLAEKEQNTEKNLTDYKEKNTQLLNQLTELSVISKSGAESIKKSLDAIDAQNKYIKELTTSIQRKDSVNLSLVTNLKKSLDNINDEDINIEVKKGVVYISLSDKLLFKSGSYEVNQSAENVLNKIAKVVNDHKDLDILIEGHTDNVPMKNSCMKDNWDLSVMRSTSIVRLLQTKYNVAPSRMTAGGRSEFLPKTSNESASGKSVNRRTEIIIVPKLDQFFQLMTPSGGN